MGGISIAESTVGEWSGVHSIDAAIALQTVS
jgi:hypothetical protein